MAGYPRAGGGTQEKKALQMSRMGLSPRGRGNLCAIESVPGTQGAIPARAGEPSARLYDGGPRGAIPARAGEPCAR